MAKPKTREIPFGTTATEIGTDLWEWETSGIKWRWRGGLGINCGPVAPDGVWQPGLYLPDLKSAGYFSEGFSAGKEWERRSKGN